MAQTFREMLKCFALDPECLGVNAKDNLNRLSLWQAG